MKKCICDRDPSVEDNEIDPALYRSNYHTLRHRIRCVPCGIKTSFYATINQAMTAWDNKGWLNRRRVA